MSWATIANSSGTLVPLRRKQRGYGTSSPLFNKPSDETVNHDQSSSSTREEELRKDNETVKLPSMESEFCDGELTYRWMPPVATFSFGPLPHGTYSTAGRFLRGWCSGGSSQF